MKKIGDVVGSNADANGEWTEGDPQTGVLATLLKGAYLNTLQRELVAIAEHNGGALDPANDKQIIDAVRLIGQPAGSVSLMGEITKGTGDTLNLPDGQINIGGNGLGFILQTQTDWDPVDVANRDTSFTALAVGDNIYIYAVQQASGIAKWIASKNSTYPTGYTANNSRKVGGFHFGRVRVVDTNGTPINGSSAAYGAGWESNVTNGSIVPNSCWDLSNRPICDPTGMAKVGRIWVDIYPVSAAVATAVSSGKLTAGQGVSAYNATPLTGTELLNQYLFNELAQRTGKRLLTLNEWTQCAEGSPQGNDADNVNAWSATTNVGRTGTGTVVNAVSARNIVDCVGNVYEWLDEFVVRWDDTGVAGQAWSSKDPMPGQGLGQLFMYDEQALVAVIAGGSWSNGLRDGSRTVSLSGCPWFVSTDVGSRFACDAL